MVNLDGNSIQLPFFQIKQVSGSSTANKFRIVAVALQMFYDIIIDSVSLIMQQSDCQGNKGQLHGNSTIRIIVSASF